MKTKPKTPEAPDMAAQVSEVKTADGKNAAAVALGRKGGSSLSKRKLKAILINAKKATKARIRKARERREAIEKEQASI